MAASYSCHTHQRTRRRLLRHFIAFVFIFVVGGLNINRSAAAASFTVTTCTSQICKDDIPNIIMSSTDTNTDDANTAATAAPYEQDGPEARLLAQYLPYFPFKGIPRFYDIGGFLSEPTIFARIIDIFASRYATMDIDVIAGLDARGFILGPPLALALRKPFIMMRKKGKMPNSISSSGYETEYGNRSGLTVQRDKIKNGDRVLIVDDLVATGGTLSSAIELVHLLGGTVVECACVVELKMFVNPSKESGLPSRSALFQQKNMEHVKIWGLVSEDVLDVEADLPEGYVDDGEEH